MSKFVNYKKRNVELPPGCKDLSDVLQRRKRPNMANVAGTNQFGGVSRGGDASGVLSDIERYVRMVFESRGEAFTLTVTPPDKQFIVAVCRMGQEAVLACVTVRMGSDGEAAVRAFFLRHDLPTPKESAMPAQFVPELPVDISYDISPSRSEPTELARLFDGLFREACGLTDSCRVSFWFSELA